MEERSYNMPAHLQQILTGCGLEPFLTTGQALIVPDMIVLPSETERKTKSISPRRTPASQWRRKSIVVAQPPLLENALREDQPSL
jgi:hypothetical protein